MTASKNLTLEAGRDVEIADLNDLQALEHLRQIRDRQRPTHAELQLKRLSVTRQAEKPAILRPAPINASAPACSGQVERQRSNPRCPRDVVAE